MVESSRGRQKQRQEFQGRSWRRAVGGGWSKEQGAHCAYLMRVVDDNGVGVV